MGIRKLENIRREDVRDLVDSKIFQRGAEYFAEGCVVNPTVAGNEMRSEVEGSSSSNYKTSVKLVDGKLRCECDCPYDWGICKHVIALLLHWIKRRQDFEDIGKKANRTAKMSKAELEKVVKTLAQEEPQVFSRIMDLALPQKLKKEAGTPNFVKQAVRVLERGADWSEMSAAIRQLRAWRERMKTRLETKQFDYVAEQLLRLADACAENYGNFDDSSGQLGGFVDECLQETEDIWKKLSGKKKLELLLLAWERAEKDKYGFESTFDSFISQTCKSKAELDMLRRPILTKLHQLEEEGGGKSENWRVHYQYERIFGLALDLGYVNRKGVYLQD